jgi:hypothetical protein
VVEAYQQLLDLLICRGLAAVSENHKVRTFYFFLSRQLGRDPLPRFSLGHPVAFEQPLKLLFW